VRPCATPALSNHICRIRRLDDACPYFLLFAGHLRLTIDSPPATALSLFAPSSLLTSSARAQGNGPVRPQSPPQPTRVANREDLQHVIAPT